jgi:hypothetical protein
MHLYWPRLLDDSGANRQWLRWLMLFLAFLWHQVLLEVEKFAPDNASGRSHHPLESFVVVGSDTARQDALNCASVKVCHRHHFTTIANTLVSNLIDKVTCYGGGSCPAVLLTAGYSSRCFFSFEKVSWVNCAREAERTWPFHSNGPWQDSCQIFSHCVSVYLNYGYFPVNWNLQGSFLYIKKENIR